MSDHSHELTPPAAEKYDIKRAGGLPKLLLTVGVVGVAGSIIACLISKEQFAHSWLFACFYFFTLCVGSLFWTCLHHATDAEWSVVVRRQMENVAKLAPIAVLFFLPIVVFFRHELWAWWSIAQGADPVLDGKRGYLNPTFFAFRYVAYGVLLWWVSSSLYNRSTAQDTDGAPKHTLMMRKFGIGGIPALALCITFAAVDYLMGLDYHWFSTMWGPYIFAGAAGSSMSLLVLVTTALRQAGYLKVVTLEHYHIMGKWMLAFSVFWAYIGFSQYMLYWYANIPEETQYYLVRNTESWWPLSLLLVIGRFFGPFAILLLQGIKKRPHQLCIVAGWIMLMQALDMYLIVLPSLHGTGVHLSIWDFLCPIAIGCSLAFLYLRLIGKTSTFPVRDPRLIESLRLRN